jgi:hypothetical protein
MNPEFSFDHDTYLHVSLHAILEVETAIRHTYLHHREQLQQLWTARERARELAEPAGVIDGVELLGDVFFEAVDHELDPQCLLDEHAERLHETEYAALRAALETLSGEWYARIAACAPTLPAANKFRLRDLSWRNDLAALLGWWRHRERLQASQRVPQTRECEDEDGKLFLTEAPPDMPARPPRRRPYDNFALYDADAHEVTVDGRALQGKLLLAVDTTRAIGNFQDIVDQLAAALAGKQAWANWELLQQGILPAFEPLRAADFNTLMSRQRDSFEVRPRHDRYEPRLIGLVCWDLHNMEGLTIDEACERTGALLVSEAASVPATMVARIRRYYNQVREDILAGKLLPWNERSVKKRQSVAGRDGAPG